MNNTKHPAEILAVKMRNHALWAEMTSADGGEDAQECSNMLRTIPAMEAERDSAISAARYETDLAQQAIDDLQLITKERDALRAALDAAHAAESVAQAASEALRAHLAAMHWRLKFGGPVDEHGAKAMIESCEHAIPELAAIDAAREAQP